MAAEAPDRDFVLLGIKYEAAKVGGLEGAALEKIANEVRAEAGESWETDPTVLRGRNAVRAEYGLPRIGGPMRSAAPTPARRSLIHRLLRR